MSSDFKEVKVIRTAPPNGVFEVGEIYEAKILEDKVTVYSDKDKWERLSYSLEPDEDGISYKTFFEIVEDEDVKFREMLQHGTQNRE